MPKKPNTPDYNFPQDELVLTSRQKLGFARRDAADFTNFGLDTTAFTLVDGAITNLVEFPTDEELAGDQISATQNKDTLAELVRNGIRPIMTRATSKFGNDSGQYRKFGTKGLSEMTDAQLSKCVHRVVRVANGFLPQLSTEGLTAEHIGNLATTGIAFDAAIDAQEDAIAQRDIASEERIGLANALYASLVKICNTGKEIWSNTNEAKYNDYVLYDSPAAQTPTPPVPPA
jgi:hypothetical protein